MNIFRDEEDSIAATRLYKYPKFMKHRYTYLVIAVVALLVIAPLLERQLPLIMPFLFLVLMLAVLGTLGLRQFFLRVLLGLGLLGFLFSVVARAFQLPYHDALYFYMAGLSADSLFLLIAITVLVVKIFSEKEITAETIKGAISVYFLMGFFWAFLYSLVLLVNPGAFSFQTGTFEYSSLTYFSFTTLTTLGYGDITPVSWMARNLTILESAFGQIYLTVLIARLVGLHIVGKRQDTCATAKDQ
jgi:hypothetical protein